MNSVKVKEIVVLQRSVIIERKKIKNLYLRILPDGTIKVNAPKKMKQEQIVGFVEKNEQWIIDHQSAVLKRYEQEPANNGFSHLMLWGEKYELICFGFDGNPYVKVQEHKILLFVKKGATDSEKEQILDKWYRKILFEEVEKIFNDCEKTIGVKAAEWRIKKMKTKWGSCNVTDKRVWLNLQLVKKPKTCLEYVILHELTHLLEASHNAVFKAYMDKFCPDWRNTKKILNS